jgi:hypothetical protein
VLRPAVSSITHEKSKGACVLPLLHKRVGPLSGIDIRHDLIENVHQSLPSHFFLSQHLSTKHHTFLPGNTSPVPRPRCKNTGRPRSSQRFSRLHRLIAKPSGGNSHGCSEYFSGAPSLLPSSLCLALHNTRDGSGSRRPSGLISPPSPLRKPGADVEFISRSCITV